MHIYDALENIKQTLIKFLYNVSIRNYLLSALIISFFLPWISYGFISKSAFVMPVYVDELRGLIALLSQGDIVIPKALDYLYVLYLYLLLLIIALIWHSRVILFITAMLPLLTLGIAYLLSALPFFNFLGFGAYSTLLGSVILLLFVFVPKKHY